MANDAFDNAAADKGALRRALLALLTCPTCRADLDMICGDAGLSLVCTGDNRHVFDVPPENGQ